MIARKILVLSRAASLAREVQVAAGPGCIVTHQQVVADIDEFIELKGPFDVVVAGPLSDSKVGMARLRQLGERYPGMSIVLALGAPVRSPLPEIVRVGAVDLVELPCDRRRMAAALSRAFERSDAAAAEEETALQPEPGMGEVISVASPTGGCGKTFYSTNLAWFLSRTGRRVCLVDLDLQFGEVMAALRLRPRYTLFDAVVRGDEEPDLEAYIEDYVVVHDSGFWVLPAPRHPADADRITLPDVTRIIDALRRRFDYIVVDTSAQLSEVTLTALEHSTNLVCMATADVPSIRNMRVFLDTLERLHVPTQRISVVLNKVEQDMGIRIEEINEALYGKVASVLPYDRAVCRSINQGRPVTLMDPKAAVSRRLVAGMAARFHVAGAEEAAAGMRGEDASPQDRRHRLGRRLFSHRDGG